MILTTLEDKFRQATLEVLGLADDSTTESRVRISWPTSGAPEWLITDNVAFIQVTTADGMYNRQKDVQYQNNNATSLTRKEIYTRIINVTWIMYGPNSFEDIDVLRNGINKNETLITNNLFVVLDRPAPNRMPELFNGQWWERSDLTLQFYEQITRDYTTPTIASANVEVKTEGGTVYNGNITP